VTDKIKKGGVKIAYYPTQEMVGDFFTKPLQGTQFVWMTFAHMSHVSALAHCIFVCFAKLTSIT